MNSSPRGGAPVAATPQEELLLLHVGLAAVTVALSSVGFLWLQGVDWLLEHGVLVPPATAIVVIPETGGAGFDLPRVAIATGVALAATAWTASTAARALRRPEDLA